jgi:hypothetical protein
LVSEQQDLPSEHSVLPSEQQDSPEEHLEEHSPSSLETVSVFSIQQLLPLEQEESQSETSVVTISVLLIQQFCPLQQEDLVATAVSQQLDSLQLDSLQLDSQQLVLAQQLSFSVKATLAVEQQESVQAPILTGVVPEVLHSLLPNRQEPSFRKTE